MPTEPVAQRRGVKKSGVKPTWSSCPGITSARNLVIASGKKSRSSVYIVVNPATKTIVQKVVRKKTDWTECKGGLR